MAYTKNVKWKPIVKKEMPKGSKMKAKHLLRYVRRLKMKKIKSKPVESKLVQTFSRVNVAPTDLWCRNTMRYPKSVSA